MGEDADVSIVDEDEDVGAGVASADADVVEPAVVSQGEDAAGVDLVVADAVMGVLQGQAGRILTISSSTSTGGAADFATAGGTAVPIRPRPRRGSAAPA
ncbi:MAG TPA: hypothetical protein VG276_21145 [Actinomycetes bacterium]|nr:hypothetical protein [Actinomycetes bacterium]